MQNTEVFTDHPSHVDCVLVHLDAYDEPSGTRFHDDPFCGVLVERPEGQSPADWFAARAR